jgi:hypothetical protein
MLSDYFIKCYKVTTTTQSDGTGGYKTTYEVGSDFLGLPSEKSVNEQLIGAIKGEFAKQYNFSTASVLKYDDIVCFNDVNSEKVYLRITKTPQENPALSLQTDWFLYSAEEINI